MMFGHVLEVRTSARRPWSHFKIHPMRKNGSRFGHVYARHLVWGKLSIIFGQPHLIPVTVCAYCHEEIQRVGEDSLDYCESCHSIEGDTFEMTTEEYEGRQ